MSNLLPRRGSQGAHRARTGRQAPLSGRQGAFHDHLSERAHVRSVDTIADARRTARGTA